MAKDEMGILVSGRWTGCREDEPGVMGTSQPDGEELGAMGHVPDDHREPAEILYPSQDPMRSTGHLLFGTMPLVAGHPLGLYERAWRRYVGAGAEGVRGSREAVNVADGDGAPDHGDSVLDWT
jgi:hypothetical protein